LYPGKDIDASYIARKARHNLNCCQYLAGRRPGSGRYAVEFIGKLLKILLCKLKQRKTLIRNQLNLLFFQD
jgi:hypothetical protein